MKTKSKRLGIQPKLCKEKFVATNFLLLSGNNKQWSPDFTEVEIKKKENSKESRDMGSHNWGTK